VKRGNVYMIAGLIKGLGIEKMEELEILNKLEETKPGEENKKK